MSKKKIRRPGKKAPARQGDKKPARQRIAEVFAELEDLLAKTPLSHDEVKFMSTYLESSLMSTNRVLEKLRKRLEAQEQN